MDWIRIGAVFGFLGVAIGAFGAHGLKDRLAATGRAANFETGVHYHLVHVAALLAVGLLLRHAPELPLARAAGWCFAAGILLFSGSLYVLALTGVTVWGAVTPFGGLGFLAGWVLLFLAGAKG
jgi:uncharacterized membrane protein YgdD (TMEM256/DUF423 family)